MATLNPYSGPWEKVHVKHLLNRTVFGKTKAQIEECVSNGLEYTVNQLFSGHPEPGYPIHFRYDEDPAAEIGETWVHKYVPPDQAPPGLNGARRRSLVSWWIGLMQSSELSIREKMVLFWHEHFAVSNINNGEVAYGYSELIRNHALGNFRTLVEEMTINAAMLIFLNGNENTKENPNENFARELLELFTIGRGDAIGLGDYTNYTEEDIVELARALTGWVARLSDEGKAIGTFIPFRHDSGTKQLSHRFDNVIINNGGAEEYKTVIDIILSKKETARYLSRQLHIWFIGSNISNEAEANVIDPLAQTLIDKNYEIEPALKALLSSEYFFEMDHIGCMITSPIDYLFKLVNTFEITMPEDILVKYRVWEAIFQASGIMEMIIMDIPSVAGWKAYYQAPGYYQYWINSFTLSQRDEISQSLFVGLDMADERFAINPIRFIEDIENATNPNDLIQGIADIIFTTALSQNQIDYLKEILIPGLPDFEWTVEYSEYLSDPFDLNKANSIRTKLNAMLKTMVNMPEFHLL